MPFSWKNSLVNFGSGSTDLNISQGQSQTASGNYFYANATIDGVLYISRTTNFRISGTLTIGSTGTIVALDNSVGQAGSGSAYPISSAISADDVLPSYCNGADGTSYGKNGIKIMANKIINNGLISANATYNGSGSANGASAGFIWIISGDISGGTGTKISCSGASGGPAWSRPSSGCGTAPFLGYNCAGGGDGCGADGTYDPREHESPMYGNPVCTDYGGSGLAGSSGNSSSITIVTNKTPTGGIGSNQAVNVYTETNGGLKLLPAGSILWYKEMSPWSTV